MLNYKLKIKRPILLGNYGILLTLILVAKEKIKVLKQTISKTQIKSKK